MDQGVKYVLELEDLLLPKLVEAEGVAVGFEAAIYDINSAAKTLGVTLGVTFAARELYNFGREVVDVAGKVESFKNLINFASSDAIEAQKNQAEVMKTITAYRLPMMETYDQYSRFLGALKGTPVEGQKAREVFDDLAKSLAVMHLPAERAGRAMYAVQEMFAEGRVQTRHFLRQLAIALPGIDAEAAKVMGVPIAKFNEMLTKKAGHGQIDAYEFLPKLFHQLSEDWGGNLPTALQSINAETTDLKNQWLEFKSDIGEEFKPELISLFNTLREGLTWIKAHEKSIHDWGIAIVKIGGYILAYKGILLGIKLAQAGWNVVESIWLDMSGVRIEKITAETGAILGQTEAVNSLVAAIERLNYVQNAQNASFITNAEGITAANTIGNRYAMSAEEAATGATAAIAVGEASLASTIATLLGTGIVIAAVVGLLEKLGVNHTQKDGAHQPRNEKDEPWKYLTMKADSSHYNLGNDRFHPFNTDPKKMHPIYDSHLAIDSAAYNNRNKLPGQLDFEKRLLELQKSDPKKYGALNHETAHSNAGSGRVESQSDRIRGQRIVTYNVTIQKMMGIENVNTTTVKENVADAADALQRMMLNVVNDSQIKDNE